MSNRDPEKNFEALWNTFHSRYPFFELRKVDWKKQYDTYRPKITKETGDEELFDILCRMIDPLDDGHVELEARVGGKKRRFSLYPSLRPVAVIWLSPDRRTGRHWQAQADCRSGQDRPRL